MAARKWYGIQPDSKERKEELENLYGFGYQCKLFRDDEKAAYIDRGKHLIPWMGDSSLMIDRYDGRGSLYDLHLYDAENSKDVMLTREEIEMEKIIDEERYMELHTDMVEKAHYEEEEMKRLNEALQANSYGAVAFNYDGSGHYPALEENGEQQQEVPEDPEEEEEEAFEPSEDLQLPANIIPPKTEKQNAIIEKTASFVAKQGNQMEIVIKTKQKDNPQFDFLNYENILNRYYRHMIKLIKTGRYTPKPQAAPRKREPSQTEGEAYLHPSLRNLAPDPEPQTSESFLASVRSKLPAGQIANTAYAKLLNNMRKHQTTSRSNSPAPAAQTHAVAASAAVAAGGSTAYDTAVQHPDTGVYGSYSSQPPVPGMEPVQLPPKPSLSSQLPVPPGTEDPSAGPVSHGPHLPPHTQQLEEEAEHQHLYGYTSPPPPPPPDIQPIVDKMANYVARNGLEFEVTVRNKNDPRFEFLHEWHHHHHYYLTKKELIKKELAEEREKQAQNIPHHHLLQQPLASSSAAAASTGVSFSIRSKEVEANPGMAMMGKTTALLGMGDSDDEDNEAAFLNKGEQDDKSGETMGHTVSLVDYPVSKPKPPPPPVTAEDALKNRLAAAAREKLITASKEDHVKAERKRKAAMFAAMLKGGSGSGQQQQQQQQPAATVTATVETPAPAMVVPIVAVPAVMTEACHKALAKLPVQGPSLPPALGFPVSSSRPPSSSSRSQRSPPPHRRHRHRSRTPPSGYTSSNRIMRRMSPEPHRSPPRSKRPKRSRSRSRTRRSNSRSHRRTRSRSRSRKSRSRSRNRSNKSSHKTSKKQKHRSRSRSKSRSRNHRKRSRSRTKRSHRSRSRSRSKKSKSDVVEERSKHVSRSSKSVKSPVKNVKTERVVEDVPAVSVEVIKAEVVIDESESSAASSSAASSPERHPAVTALKMEKSDSESETERLRQAALDSEASNLRAKALATNGMNVKIKEETVKEEDSSPVKSNIAQNIQEAVAS